MQFLNQHAETLRHLCLQYVKPTSKSLILPVLPRLESLDILDDQKSQKSSSWEGLDTARAYIQHSRNTLTGLGLTHCSLSLHDLGLLLDLLGRRSSENVEGGRLKSLTVTVQVLTPDLLDTLAEKLPQLERLEVNFACLRGTDVQTEDGFSDYLTPEDIEGFLLELKKRSYLRWALKSFGFGDETVCVRSVAMMMMILMLLALCIPRLVELDGLNKT